MISSKKLGIAAFVVLALVSIATYFLYQRHRSPEEGRPEPAAKIAGVAGAPPRANDRIERRPPSKRMAEKPATAKVSQESRAIKPASISGRVRNQQDEPIAAARVEVEVCKDTTGIEVLKTYGADTGEEGVYKVIGIDVFGSAHVYVAAEGYSTGRAEKNLMPGLDLTGINMTLRKAVTAVEGWVVSRAMEPLPGASIRIRYYGYPEKSLEVTAKTGGSQGFIGDSPWTSARTDRDGHFAIPLDSEGLCDFTVIKEGFAAGFFPMIPAGTKDAQFVLGEYAALEGKVIREDGSPAGDVQVEITGYALPGGLGPSDVAIQSFSLAPASFKSDESGTYRARGLSADYWYKISARETGGDGTIRIARIEAVPLQEGRVTKDVDLVLVPSETLPPAIVKGRVTYAGTDRPAHPLVVFASLNGEGERCSDMVDTDRDGLYELRAKVEGKTLLHILWLDRNSGGYAPPGKGVEFPRLMVSPGREGKLDFTVGHAPFSICIRFVDRDRKPIEDIAAGMQVIRDDEPCGEQGSKVKSDADGRAVWEGLSPDETYEALGFGKGGIVGRSRRFTGHPGESEVEVVCVSRTAGLKGIVLDVDEKPLDKDIVCSAAVPEGVNLYGKDVCERTYNIEADGTFYLREGMPEGKHQKLVVRRVENRDASGQEIETVIKMAFLEDVDLLPGEIRDIGTLHLRQVSREEAERILGTPDPWMVFERYKLFGHP